MKIPFVDLKYQYLTIKNEIDREIKNVINSSDFILGKQVHYFEDAFSKKLGINNVIAVANGTDAIYASLKALGVGYKDEVITVANSWISTSETISQTGAKPVFVDIDKNHNINHRLIQNKINKRTKAIIAVHLYGQPCNIREIVDICKKHNLKLIEDCAQAHFSKYGKKFVGTFGDISTFSFYPGKNLGAYGDAGCVATNNNDLAKKVRIFVRHGAEIKHKHLIEGINSRMDTIQAAILNVKLKYIDTWTNQRIKNAELYSDKLKDVGDLILPITRNDCIHTFHVYCIKTSKRKELQDFLKQKNIQTAIHYPTPLPLLEAYQYLNYKPSDFPISNKYKDQILSLPMYPELNESQINYVVDSIKDFFDE